MAEMMRTSAELSSHDKMDHVKARLGLRRMSHKVKPGLYVLGDPGPEAKMFVTGNYTLSFDALRSALKGMDAYIMVLDTRAINVWCAAGKGTFGTDEVVERIEKTELAQTVSQRTLILPQLSASGVSAHEVKRRSGFRVEYGPVRAEDIPEYLRLGKATEEMRQVRFNLKDRLALVPVEIKQYFLYLALIIMGMYLIGGYWPALMVLTVFVTGIVLFPMLLPFIPSRSFSGKGLVLGAVVAVLVSIIPSLLSSDPNPWWMGFGALENALLMSPWVGYIALNFTGSSTFTSRTGVRKEIFTYIRVFAALFITGVALLVAVKLMQAGGMF